MRRKLALLNTVLLALTALAVWRIWRVHEDTSARENSILNSDPESQAVAPTPAGVPPEELTAIDYIAVAEQLLFSPDRNANVEIEAAPEQPLPPLPTAHGILDLGSGPTAILSAPDEEGQRAYRVGDSVGDFVLVGIGANELSLEWDGGVVRRSLDDLGPREDNRPIAAAPPVPKPAAPEKPKTTVLSESVRGPLDVDMGGGVLACRPGDTSPAGTVFNGYRKVISRSPFGETCRWEPVQ